MNFFNEKEKKLNQALANLKKLNLNNPELKNNMENLAAQKNQLEIEKQELEKKYASLIIEHEELTKKLDEFKNQEKIEKKKTIKIF